MILGLCLLLSSCDLHPIYAKGGDDSDISVNRQIAQITVLPISDRSGQLLRNSLENRISAARSQFGDESESLGLGYSLKVTVDSSAVNQGEQIDATSIYGLVYYKVTMNLVDLNNQSEVIKSSFSIQRSFSLPRDGFAEIAAVNDAHKLSMNEISQTIIDRLQIYFDKESRK